MSEDKNINYSLKKEVTNKFISFSECFDFLNLLDILSCYFSQLLVTLF